MPIPYRGKQAGALCWLDVVWLALALGALPFVPAAGNHQPTGLLEAVSIPPAVDFLSTGVLRTALVIGGPAAAKLPTHLHHAPPFRTPLYPWLPIFGVVSAAVLISAMGGIAMLFVLLDGWARLIHGIVLTYTIPIGSG